MINGITLLLAAVGLGLLLGVERLWSWHVGDERRRADRQEHRARLRCQVQLRRIADYGRRA